jgi:hypothetical protein
MQSAFFITCLLSLRWETNNMDKRITLKASIQTETQTTLKWSLPALVASSQKTARRRNFTHSVNVSVSKETFACIERCTSQFSH